MSIPAAFAHHLTQHFPASREVAEEHSRSCPWCKVRLLEYERDDAREVAKSFVRSIGNGACYRRLESLASDLKERNAWL